MMRPHVRMLGLRVLLLVSALFWLTAAVLVASADGRNAERAEAGKEAA